MLTGISLILVCVAAILAKFYGDVFEQEKLNVGVARNKFRGFYAEAESTTQSLIKEGSCFWPIPWESRAMGLFLRTYLRDEQGTLPPRFSLWYFWGRVVGTWLSQVGNGFIAVIGTAAFCGAVIFAVHNVDRAIDDALYLYYAWNVLNGDTLLFIGTAAVFTLLGLIWGIDYCCYRGWIQAAIDAVLDLVDDLCCRAADLLMWCLNTFYKLRTRTLRLYMTHINPHCYPAGVCEERGLRD